ncbi:hypothetical protein [Bythopirellula goksoeyrii]|uniref:Uncharacterized protein n=1 Tax=Bythopirellula goksoeyrii TaxID=1400387 RepID=A0A5B9QFA4_9BACT|nr:hypothetical protein [Bythopirellula goksoeyrii]QEG35586.1 hypothetical protein Pr1d_28880 [Bythopirellula goksoeyrii]
MSLAAKTPDAKKAPSGKKYQLTVNSYDRTATLIIALLILVGFTVLGLMIVFFADKMHTSVQPIPVVPVEATSANANQGLAAEPDPPGSEEAEELEDPQLEDMLDTLTDAVTSKEVLLSDEDLEAEDVAGKGKGLGDARMAGEGNDGVVERVPRWERWKIRFEPKSPSEFAQWLDYNKIEIGVLGRDNLVHYGYDLSKSNKQTRTGEPTKDSRGYTAAADGPMPALTERLAREADIAKEGNITLLFYPFEVESILWTLENEYSEGRDVNTIRETVFTVEHNGSDFSFKVIDQRYF